jgi:glycerophosphoryl diester phosphodiesterase
VRDRSAFIIQGHRGARGLRPENTLPSFEAALDAGATSLETDVHLTADGIPVLVHDPWLDEGIIHTAGAAPSFPPPASRPMIHRLSLDELRGYVADCNPDPNRFRDQSAEPTPLAVRFASRGRQPFAVPTLAELYEFVAAYAGEPGRHAGKTEAQQANAGCVVIDVELKRMPFHAAELGQAPGRMEAAVLDVIRAAGAVARTAVRSFDHRCVKRVRELEPGLTGVVLVEGTAPVDPVALVRAANAQVYGPDYNYLDEAQVWQCHAAGITVLPWTANDPAVWERLVAWGVDGITTDYPDRLAAWLARAKESGLTEAGYSESPL